MTEAPALTPRRCPRPFLDVCRERPTWPCHGPENDADSGRRISGSDFSVRFFRSDLPESDFPKSDFPIYCTICPFPHREYRTPNSVPNRNKIRNRNYPGKIGSENPPHDFPKSEGPVQNPKSDPKSNFQPLYKSAQIVQRIENRSWAGQSATGCGATRGYSGFR